MKSGVARITRLYYGFQFFFSLLLWTPVFFEYQKQMGLSDSQIFSIQSIYYIAFCFLEIPTGFVADRFGHRNCMKLGAVLLVLSNVLPVVSSTYIAFLAHFLLIALSRSLISGASSAYIYDRLKEAGESVVYKQVEGNARSYGLIGKIVGWAAMGPLMKWYLPMPYLLTALSALISVGFAWALPAASVGKGGAGEATRTAKDLKWSGVFTALKSAPDLLFIMVQGVGLFVLARIVQINLFQPILRDKGYDLASFGWVMSVISIFEAVGSARPQWIRKFCDDLTAVYVLTLLMALSLAVIPVAGQWGTLVQLSLFSLVTGFSFPIQRQLLNDAITVQGGTHYRATLLSVESIVDRAVCAGVAYVLGGFASGEKLHQFLNWSAGLTAAMMVLLYGSQLAFKRLRPVSEVIPDSRIIQQET
ncbi:MAG: MFS transporter [Methylotenera sp.]|nr:MFS transporter [Oligoflexia bacterium]